MKHPSLFFAAFACVSLVATSAFVGCGSENDGDPNTNAGEAGAEAGTRPDGAACGVVGETCGDSAECCSDYCDPASNTCATTVANCAPGGESCSAGPQCCTFACVDQKCSHDQCTADGEACTVDGQCCGGKCGDDKRCVPLNDSCKTSGNPCGGNGDCCSKLCTGGFCDGAPSFCRQTGDVCADSFECCAGACNKADGATVGTCGVADAPGTPNCSAKGTVCGQIGDTVPECGGECCTKVCAPNGANAKVVICQSASGCAPTGEVCRNDSDCCGWSGSPAHSNHNNDPRTVVCAKGSPTQEFGRCSNGNVCSPAGVICKPADMACSAANNCCRPNGDNIPSNYCNTDPANCCRKDALGIPRCLLNVVDCTNDPPPAGASCASSADCCGKPCVNNVCEGKCVEKNGECTSHADCCTGLPCNIPTGASKGICGGSSTPDGGVTNNPGGGGTGDCALYGQSCSDSSPCCSGIPCVGGICALP
jgi:hypothetical protein